MFLRFFRRGTTEKSPAQQPETLSAAAIVREARRLRFRVRPAAAAELAGAYHGARPGAGPVFSELKPYEPGDDARHLDWNVTARHGKPYVRRFVEERALALRLVVDVSAGMRFGPEGRSKADRASQAAALLATAAIRNGDRVGLLLVSDRVEVEIPLCSGTRGLARVIRALVASPVTSRGTKLSAALEPLARGPRRSLIVVLSDFHSIDNESAVDWRRLSIRNEAVFFRVVEPRERAIPDAGLLILRDSETGERTTLDSTSKSVRAAYESAAERRAEAFRTWRSSAGASGADLPTEIDPIRPLIRYFLERPGRRFRR